MKYPQGEIKRQAVVVPGGLQSVINRLESPSTWAAAVPLGKAPRTKTQGSCRKSEGYRPAGTAVRSESGPHVRKCLLRTEPSQKKKKQSPELYHRVLKDIHPPRS